MMEGIKEETVINLFNLQVQKQVDPVMAEDGTQAVPAGPVIMLPPPNGQASAPAEPPASQPRHAAPPPAARQSAPQRAAQPAAAAQGQPAPRRASQGQPAQGQPAQGQPAPAGRPASQAAAQPAGSSLPAGLARPQRAGSLSYSAPSEDATGRATHSTATTNGDSFANVGRNAPCPCGSGKKFKQCHGDPRNR
jgi:preprotein translocase subunit SecA